MSEPITYRQEDELRYLVIFKDTDNDWRASARFYSKSSALDYAEQLQVAIALLVDVIDTHNGEGICDDR